jgi:DEAD/DEAH box helicase domain-containing protein
MTAPPWKLATGLEPVLSRWLGRAAIRGCFTAARELAPEAPRFSDHPSDLASPLVGALHRRGIEALYAHQRSAIDAARAGRHVVVATPTASGKSLCFHLPVLDAIAREPGATALYLYPTKALSRDQEQGVYELVAEAGLSVGAIVYDGDTPGDARRAARERAALVMTNPDMLHAGILPQHASWVRLFSNLRYVVLDELHTYRGVFGSHVANVIARLRRVARFHGADPVFVCATATIQNPVEHSARLLGVDPAAITLVDQSTAPRGRRRVFVYNPPVVNAELGIRASYLKTAVRLTADLVKARVPTIVFGQSRNAVEIMLKYLRDRFADQPSIRDAIVAYRSGYLPDQRRRVERGLRSGDIVCVVATSALELGIDIRDLDAVVCAGYPGSLAETWQRFGRAGRRSGESLALLITSSTPLDQYVAAHAGELLDRGVEEARIEPDNAEIVIQHLKCAAFELPFRRGEVFGPLAGAGASEGGASDGASGIDDTAAALGFLEDHGVIHASGDRYHWSDDSFPAHHVSLRSVGWDNTVIIDVESGLTLAELDWHATPTMLHEQAIYQHDGTQYQVERLDYENHKAFVRKVEPDYFTTAMRHLKVRVLEVEDTRPLHGGSSTVGAGAPTGWGDVCVTEKVVGYKKVKFHSHENAGYGDVRLPDVDLHTTAFWLTVPATLVASMGRVRAIEGLRGLSHALELSATLALMCDPHDIGRAIEDSVTGENGIAGENGVTRPNGVRGAEATNEAFSATAYLYDHVPGGVGLAARIFDRAAELITHAARLVAGCSCLAGCPSCVGATASSAELAPHGPSPTEIRPRTDLDRRGAALELARHLGVDLPATLGPPSPPPTSGPPTSGPPTNRPEGPARPSHLRLVT